MAGWKQLDIGVIGGGIGGLSVALALRRSGHLVTIYERADFAGEVGAQYMHAMLMECAVGKEGEGRAARLLVNHACESVDSETGTITFKNGVKAIHDLVIGADGIGSVVRKAIDIHPVKKPADSSCLHANVMTEDAVRLGLVDYSQHDALEYWGGQEGKWDKISWGGQDRPVEELLAPYPNLDAQVKAHLAIGIEVQPWRLWVHEPYPYLTKGKVCLLGDAGHPMMPHQSQGACMAIEDAGALGVLFNKQYFNGDIEESLAVYNSVRLPRATRVQAAAARAAYNINERIGFSDNKHTATYKVENEKAKLTIEEMNAYDMFMDIEEQLAAARNVPFTRNFIKGMPE
ncbi:putative 6-hydroxynicotinate 3-monooxygenase [Glarea lozoyensis 74030]|uniref:Putative 6-hydroxynicotinate 3-monooxygenase n=1 Tax=Glarea lozoyensis (strain ATCC 74030 / MF5533) TaxID=1104152 RepID=H0EYB9_GLAL7|nr:putative 6-hydroxynicotinate 3-monooxygenase [Glarea lozoyensis 74030]